MGKEKGNSRKGSQRSQKKGSHGRAGLSRRRPCEGGRGVAFWVAAPAGLDAPNLLSRRDVMMVARHEMPGKRADMFRPVGNGVIRSATPAGRMSCVSL
jgi:hypothetical protein